MTDKDLYMMGYTILHNVRQECGGSLSSDEGEVLKKAQGVLAKLYASDAMWDIFYAHKEGFTDIAGVFCDKTIDRIKAYHQSAENGLKVYVSQEEEEE